MEIISYRVGQILFCSRGPLNSPLSCCWAFTTSHASTSSVEPAEKSQLAPSKQDLFYQSQVFRCDNPDAVSLVLFGCSTETGKSRSSSSVSTDLSNSVEFCQCISTNKSVEKCLSLCSTDSTHRSSPQNLSDWSGVSSDRCSIATAVVVVIVIVVATVTVRVVDWLSVLLRYQRRNDRSEGKCHLQLCFKVKSIRWRSNVPTINRSFSL
jgi:hypothetical protein